MENSDSPASMARTFAQTASEAFKDQASYFASLPDDAWEGPTGCEKWTIDHLAGHIVGEAIWFPHQVRVIVDGAEPLPDSLWEELTRIQHAEQAQRMASAADDLVPAITSATADDLQTPVDLGFAALPLWQAMYTCMFEAVYHNWDGRAGRQPNATVPTAWAQKLAILMPETAPMLAHSDALAGATGTYLLQVGDGVGPVTVTVRQDGVTVERGQTGTPDVTLYLDADQYVRVPAGRFRLSRAIGDGKVRVEGDADKAAGLNRVFAGIKGSSD